MSLPLAQALSHNPKKTSNSFHHIARVPNDSYYATSDNVAVGMTEQSP
jgi:hypothetical protein